METKAYSLVCLDNGENIKLEHDLGELIEKFTGKDGKIRDEFIEIGLYYINPRHVSMITYEEKKQASGPIPKPPGW